MANLKIRENTERTRNSSTHQSKPMEYWKLPYRKPTRQELKAMKRETKESWTTNKKIRPAEQKTKKD